MTVQPPPPPSGTSVPGGRSGDFVYRKGVSEFHTIRHSDYAPGVDFSLRSMTRIWNEGAPVGAKNPTFSPLQMRLQTIKLLELFIASQQGGVLGIPKVLSGLVPARLSDIGIAIGSVVIQNRKQHIDEEWFGPYRQSWWDPVSDGRQFEVKIAQCLLTFLKGSLGKAGSGRRGVPISEDTSDVIEGFFSSFLNPVLDAEILRGAQDDASPDLYIEWCIADKDGPNPRTDVECHIDGNKLRIVTPDIQ